MITLIPKVRNVFLNIIAISSSGGNNLVKTFFIVLSVHTVSPIRFS